MGTKNSFINLYANQILQNWNFLYHYILRIFFQQRLQQGDSLIGAEQTADLHGTMAWCNAARSRQITMNGALTPMLQLKNIL